MKSTHTRSIAVRLGRSAMSVLLSGALVLSTVPTSALAEVATTDAEDEVEALVVANEDDQDQELVADEQDGTVEEAAAEDEQDPAEATDDENQGEPTTDEGVPQEGEGDATVVDEDGQPDTGEGEDAAAVDDEAGTDEVTPAETDPDSDEAVAEDEASVEEAAEEEKAEPVTDAAKTEKAEKAEKTEKAEEPVLTAADASDYDLSDAKVTVATQTYTGSKLTPEPKVVLNGQTLVKGTDYTCGYENNLHASKKAIVNITGKGQYTGATEAYFTINPASLSSATVSGLSDKTYTGGVIKPNLTVKVGGRTLSLDVDYTVTYKDAVKVGTATITIKGVDDYTGSLTKTFKIVPQSLSGATVSGLTSKTYTGSAIKPKVVVKLNGTTLTAGTDYTVAYKNNTNVGKATVTITGKGNYKGTLSKTFAIKAVSIKNAKVSSVSKQRWTGKAIKPTPTVKIGSKTLKLNRDYTLSYANNVKANSTATITIKGKGNYTGSKSITFKIGPRWGEWVSGSGGWWYRWADGTYPKSELLTIDGGRYYFDASGWMATGWRLISGYWYYFTPGSGRMVSNGWKYIDGTWYSFNVHGRMRTGWYKDGNNWYYLGTNGAMATGWVKSGGHWYYMHPTSGIMQTGWEKVDGYWYYLEKNGIMATGWKTFDGETYFLQSSGAMAVGWLKISGSVYHFASNGTRDTGWVKIDGSWYHFEKDGVASSGWWQDSGSKAWYYLSSQGKMITGWKTISNERYWFDGSGVMATGWKEIDGRWYHFDSNGHLERSRWIDNHYVGTNGYMYTDRYTPDGYYVDKNGVWDGKAAVKTN